MYYYLVSSYGPEIFGGGPPAQGGGPLLQKIRDFWDIKLQIFGAEGAENFKKFRVLREKSAIFWSFKGKFGQILIDIVIMDYFGCKNSTFFDFEKVEKISGNFRKILGNFSKKIAGHKTPNFENFRKFVYKNAIKRGR